MEGKTVPRRSLKYFVITVLSPLFPVCVLIVLPHIAQAGKVFFVSLILLIAGLWVWVGMWRSETSRTMKIIGMLTGGAGVVLCIVLVVCAGILFCIIT